MKGITKWVASSLGIGVLLSVFAYAQEPLPMFGIQATVGPAFGVGDSNIRNNAQVGSAVGGAFVVNATRHLGGFFAYDRLDLSQKIPAIAETLTGGLVLRAPELAFAGWTPYIMGGAGIGRQDESVALDKLAVKASLGVERFFTPNLALGITVNYHYIAQTGEPTNDSVHAIVGPALVTSYYFGPGVQHS